MAATFPGPAGATGSGEGQEQEPASGEQAVGHAAPDGATASAPLRDLAVRSGAYLAGREAVGMWIRLAGVVITVREIGPSAFGLYSSAAAFVFFAAGLAQMGAEVYLIRSPGPVSKRSYDEAFTFLVCTSALVTGVCLGLTFLVAPWLRPVGVVMPLRVLLLSVPLNILWAPAQACIERKFAYRRMGFLELGGDIALYGTAVPLAMTGAGLWSLVAGYFAWQAWLFFGSLALSGLRPRFAWSRETCREMLRHGWSYSLSTWLTGLERSATVLIVGTFAGAAGVGFVTFAQRLVTTLNFTQRGVHRVGIVAISRAGRPEPAKLGRALEEGSLLLMLVAAAPFAAFGLVAHWVVPGVFGSTWEPAVPIYVLLAFVAVMGVPSSVQRTLLFAHGRNLPVALANGLELVGLTGASIVLVHAFGLIGFGYASLVTLGSTAYTHHAAGKFAAVRYRRLIVPVMGLVPPALAAVIPFPWEFLTLVPLVALVALPSTRRELRLLAATVQAMMTRRATATQGVPPAASTAPPVLPVPSASPVPSIPPVPSTLGPAAFVATGALSAVALLSAATSGGTDMALNGSVAHNGSSPRPDGTLTGDLPHRPPDRPGAGWSPHQADDGMPGLLGLSGVEGLAAPAGAGAPSREPAAVPDRTGPEADPVLDLLARTDGVTGLPPLGMLLARTGRLLGAARDSDGSLLVAAFELAHPGVEGPAPAPVLAAVADALRAALRFDDPIARVGPELFVVAAPLAPGASDGRAMVAHLASAISDAVTGTVGAPAAVGYGVHEAHVVAVSPFVEEADQLVRRVVGEAHAR